MQTLQNKVSDHLNVQDIKQASVHLSQVILNLQIHFFFFLKGLQNEKNRYGEIHSFPQEQDFDTSKVS